MPDGDAASARHDPVDRRHRTVLEGRIVGHGRQVSDEELDRALAAGKLELTRPNARAVSCVRVSCRRIVGPEQARQLWIDGHKRGFPCLNDCWNLGG
jgi:hypothetical protein